MRIAIIICIITYLVGLGLSTDSEAITVARLVQLSVDEIKGANYVFPAFKVSIFYPDGNIVGWDANSGQWTGNILSSEIREAPFAYPDSGHECTSNEAVTERRTIFSPDARGRYSLFNALYCKDIVTGETSFIASGYGSMISGPDGKYSAVIYPEKNSIINLCFSYAIDNEEPHNELCVDPAFIRNLIITPGIEQTIEFTYNYTDKAANKVEKIVTPATLSGSWESCNSLGMIKNRGLYNSIRQKLDNASKKAASGDQKAATNIYSAVANELQAQSGKGIDRMCADILAEDLKSDVR